MKSIRRFIECIRAPYLVLRVDVPLTNLKPYVRSGKFFSIVSDCSVMVDDIDIVEWLRLNCRGRTKIEFHSHRAQIVNDAIMFVLTGRDHSFDNLDATLVDVHVKFGSTSDAALFRLTFNQVKGN